MMIALADISSATWVLFIAAILFFLALDLGVFHRRARVVRLSEAMLWTGIWFAIAMVFAFVAAPAMVHSWTRDDTLKFITGYLIELSLSMDNVFVIALLFSFFAVPKALQHRVLFWGILGALLMRGLMVGAGVVVIREFEWVLYAMGAFLLFSGVKMMLGRDEEVDPERNIIIRLVRTFYPVSASFDGQHFTTRMDGRRILTPLALVLVSVETTDLIFAIDSLPAIFGVTRNGFIIFTSNVFAILGLRSLYVLLAEALNYFRYLKAGLALVLVFIGVKMLLDPHDAPPKWFQADIANSTSLALVGGIIAASVAVSLVAGRHDARSAVKR